LSLGIKRVTEEHLDFLNEYEKLIDIRVNSTIRDIAERDDVKQYVKLELIKAYKNHRKYADWKNIVLSIIKRRIFDYRKKIYKTPLYELHNRKGLDDTYKTSQEVIDSMYLNRGEINENENSRFETSDYLEHIWRLVGENEHLFTEWELDYIGALYDAYDNDIGFETEPERLELMGIPLGNKAEVKVFRKQVKKFIEKVRMVTDEDRMV
jgi:hypothetical protein